MMMGRKLLAICFFCFLMTELGGIVTAEISSTTPIPKPTYPPVPSTNEATPGMPIRGPPVRGPPVRCFVTQMIKKCTPYILVIYQNKSSPLNVALSGREMQKLCSIALAKEKEVVKCVEEEMRYCSPDIPPGGLKNTREVLLSHIGYCKDGQECGEFIAAHDEIQECLAPLSTTPHPGAGLSSGDVCSRTEQGINCTFKGLKRCPKLWNRIRRIYTEIYKKQSRPDNRFCPEVEIPGELPVKVRIKPSRCWRAGGTCALSWSPRSCKHGVIAGVTCGRRCPRGYTCTRKCCRRKPTGWSGR